MERDRDRAILSVGGRGDLGRQVGVMSGSWSQSSRIRSSDATWAEGTEEDRRRTTGGILPVEEEPHSRPRMSVELTGFTFVRKGLQAAGKAVESATASWRASHSSDRKTHFMVSPAGSETKGKPRPIGNSWNHLRWEYNKQTERKEEEEAEQSCFRKLSIPVFHDQKLFVSCWDIGMLLGITYTTLVLPYHATFGEMIAWDWWLLFHLLLDFIFLLDTLLQFNISYYSMKRQVTVLSRRNIVKHYLHGMFLVDFISILPLDLTIWAFQNGFEEKGSAVVRVASLLRLLRLTRLKRIVHRVEASVPINYGLWTVLNFLLMTVVLSHWVACVWGMLGEVQLELRSDSRSWMLVQGEEYGLVWDPEQHIFVKGEVASDADAHEAYMDMVDIHPRFFMYTLSLYFTVYSLASVGYGDLVPVTDLERYFSCCVMILGSYFLGYIVASITSVVATRNADSSDYYRLMDQLGRFMDEHDLDRELRIKLRNYFHYRRQTRGMQSWQNIINQMSPSLRKEVFAHTSCQLIQDIELFKDCDDGSGGFIMDLGTCLETNTYTPKESIVAIDDKALAMYIVRRGVVASEGAIYMRHGVFGMDMVESLIRDEVFHRSYMAIALTYSDVLLINRSSLQKIWTMYPISQQKLRSRILRRILKQEIKAYTAAMTRIISGSRPYWSRLRGDQGGREKHYYNKLLSIIPTDDSCGGYLQMVTAATRIQRAFRRYRKIRRIDTMWRAPTLALQKLALPPAKPKSVNSDRSIRSIMEGASSSSIVSCGPWAELLKELENVKQEVGGLRDERKKTVAGKVGARRSTVLHF